MNKQREENKQTFISKKRKRAKYRSVDNTLRKQLINLVQNEKIQLKQASQNLNINYSTAKTIVRIWKRENRVMKKTKIFNKNQEKYTNLISGSFLSQIQTENKIFNVLDSQRKEKLQDSQKKNIQFNQVMISPLKKQRTSKSNRSANNKHQYQKGNIDIEDNSNLPYKLNFLSKKKYARDIDINLSLSDFSFSIMPSSLNHIKHILTTLEDGANLNKNNNFHNECILNPNEDICFSHKADRLNFQSKIKNYKNKNLFSIELKESFSLQNKNFNNIYFEFLRMKNNLHTSIDKNFTHYTNFLFPYISNYIPQSFNYNIFNYIDNIHYNHLCPVYINQLLQNLLLDILAIENSVNVINKNMLITHNYIMLLIEKLFSQENKS